MKKIIGILIGVAIVVVGVILFVKIGPAASWIPTPDYRLAYRLVPETVSKSAAITIAVPKASGDAGAHLSESVTFTPKIDGRWIQEKDAGLGAAAAMSVPVDTYYFQPDRALEQDRHYGVSVALGQGRSLSSDFLAVADPEILSILPVNDEVTPDMKISIVFNRPMVPLGTVDSMSPTDLPVRIVPQTPGRFKWVSTRTLQFIPDNGLISSANYTVAVGDGLKSMEGLPVKPQKSSFSTYHLRYIANDKNGNTKVVRGYNQPFLISFNQPVNVNATAAQIVVRNDSGEVKFSAAYGKKKTDTGEEADDNTLLAIYPEGGANGSWQPNQNYNVTVNKAFPLSGGDIATDETRTFSFSVDDIVASTIPESPKGQIDVSSFDPEGTLAVTFYEDIDLDKSKIDAPGLKDVVYGEKCQSGGGSGCTKVPDRSRIILSFDKNAFKPGDPLPVRLYRIVTAQGRQITSDPLLIDLKIYQPLTIYKVSGGDSLSGLSICSNNAIAPIQKAANPHKIDLDPAFEPIGRIYSNRVIDARSGQCEIGQFWTQMEGFLRPSTSYRGSMTLADVFGGTATKQVDFQTREVRRDDYSLRSYQGSDVVTVRGKTKLTFSTAYLPDVTATVCKLRPYDFQKARAERRGSGYPCVDSVTRTIPLDQTRADAMFSVDIKDFYPAQLGNYVVMLSSPLVQHGGSWDYQNQAFVSVTDLIVTEKRISPVEKGYNDLSALSGDQISGLQNLYWVISATTHQPVAGATLGVYKQGALVGTAMTDQSGIASMAPIPGADLTIATYDADSIAVSGTYGAVAYASSAGNKNQLYLYTDKPLYRPGESVNLKGIYRTGYDGQYEARAGTALALQVYDSSGRVISTDNLSTNQYGSVSDTVQIGKEAPLGAYRACVEYTCAYFDVLEYAPAAFKVEFDSVRDEIVAGDKPTVGVRSSYYFGVPLSNATLSYRVSSQHYNFEKFEGEYYSFNNLYADEQSSRYYYGDRYISSGDSVLDENGEARISPDLGAAGKDMDTSKIIILDATVKDQQGRSVSGQKSFVLHAAPLYIGSEINDPFVPSGQPVRMKVKSVDTKGTPSSLGSIKAETYLVKWISPKEGNSGIWTKDRKLVKTDYISTDRNGDAVFEARPTEEGEYEIDITKKGDAVGSRSWFYSYGTDAVSVRSGNDTYLNVVSNRENLKPGEKGEIVFEVPEGSAKALVTIERGKVFSYQVIDVTGTIGHYEFMVAPAYYPNVYVSVVAYAPGHEVRVGNKRFIIDSGQKKVNLKIVSDRASYDPGDTVHLSLTATDDGGQPLRSEVSLAVVDMSVLALRGNPKKDPVTEFYGNIPLTVATYSNFNNLLEYTEKSAADGKGGGGGDLSSQKRRGLFREVAYWNPDIMTDASGQAGVTFKLPDNLTTWRAEAVAVTKDTKLGAAYDEFTTNKIIMATPLKPRFIIPGDSFKLGATVFNRSNSQFRGNVSLAAPTLLSSKDDVVQDISIDGNGSKTVYWDVRVPLSMKPGPIAYSVDVKGTGGSDAVDDTLVVRPNTSYEVTATAGETDSSTSETIYLPQDVSTEEGGLTIRSSATLAVFLTKGLEYLIAYPYGCTEQISSQIRGVALVKRALDVPNIANDVTKKTVLYNDKEYTLDQVIQEGLQTLYSRQNEDGGFSYWGGDRQSSYQATLEAIDAFRVLRDTGVPVDADRIGRAARYLYAKYSSGEIHLDAAQTIELITGVFVDQDYRASGALTQSLDRAVSELLSDRRTTNGSILKASLLLHRYGLLGASLRDLDRVLKNKTVVDSRGSFIDVGTDGSYFDTAISNTAHYVDILAASRTDDPQLSDMLRWLTASRDRDGAWGSTKNTLAVVEALSDYLVWKPETSAAFDMENTVNGKSVQQFSFTPQTILSELEARVPLGELSSGGLSTVLFTKSNDTGGTKGKIYYDLSLKYYLPETELPARDEGLAIKREMYAATDKESGKPLAKAKVGDVVREHIEIVVPVTRRNVLVEDFIPAGMEIVDTSLATEDQTLDTADVKIKNARLYANHTEMRDDRLLLSVDELAQGTYEYDYYLRALIPGTFVRLPSVASESYNPENFGRTSSGRFMVDK